MTRTYTLNAALANKACEILKTHSYYDVADILNELARQDAQFDELEQMAQNQSDEYTPPPPAPKKRRTRTVK